MTEARARRRGRPRRISRERIIEVARGMDPATLTMKGVADALGVDPSAVNYHVADRDNLRELVAAEVVLDALQAAPLPEGADWREGLAHFARVLRDAVIRSGAHSVYFVLPASGTSRVFAPVEQVYRLLIEAGMSVDDAVHAIAAVNQITYSSAREAVLAQRDGGHPQRAEVERALASDTSGELVGAKDVAARWRPDSEEQFEYNTAVIIEGIGARLRGRSGIVPGLEVCK